MLRSVTYILLLILSLTLFSQYGLDGGYMVLDSDGVTMRAGPGTNFPAVKAVPFGEMLRQPQQRKNGKQETLEGMAGTWRYLKHEAHEGFVFDAYISPLAQPQSLNYQKGEPQFFDMALPCGSYLFYNKELKWYAVVENEYNQTKLDIVPVEMDFQISSDAGVVLEAEPELYISPYLNIELNVDVKPKFLVGLPKRVPKHSIAKGQVPVKSVSNEVLNRPLLPGDVIQLGLSYKLYCFGSFNDSNTNDIDSEGNVIINDYSVKIASDKTGEIVYQELDIGPTDIITFIGDLNYDSVMDIIVETRPGWSETYTKLFMSGYGVETYREVAGNYWGGCH